RHCAHLHVHTLPLHDALPISVRTISNPSPARAWAVAKPNPAVPPVIRALRTNLFPPLISHIDIAVHRFHRSLGADPEYISLCRGDRKSTRLNSSHVNISYAVF